MALAITKAAPSGATSPVRRDKDKAHASLVELARAQLLATGIAAINIDEVDGCTRCDAERFHSYRRDGQQAGRHVAAIVSG